MKDSEALSIISEQAIKVDAFNKKCLKEQITRPTNADPAHDAYEDMKAFRKTISSVAVGLFSLITTGLEVLAKNSQEKEKLG